TLKVIDLDAAVSPIKQIIPTGGTTRVDEMDVTTDGTILIAANNAEDPPFATLFKANGDPNVTNVSKIAKGTVSHAIVPGGFGLSLEQPAWDPTTKRFYTSIPTIANNPTGCDFGQGGGGPPCSGGLLVTDPAHPPTAPQGPFDSASGT